MDPLESILKDVRAMKEALDELESPTGGTPSSVAKSVSQVPRGFESPALLGVFCLLLVTNYGMGTVFGMLP